MFYRRKNQSYFLALTHRYKITALLFLGSFLGQVAIDLYTPSLPIMQAAFHTTSVNMQLSLTFYILGYGIMQLLFGYLVDKIGRRQTLFIGYAGFLLATVFILQTQDITYFLLLRGLQGAFAAALQVVMRVGMRDLFHGRELSKVSGIYSTAWALVPVLAPALGSYIQHYLGWHMHFQLILLLTGFCFLLNWHLLPETGQSQKAGNAKHFIHAIWQHLCNAQFLVTTILVSFSSTIMLSYITIAPFLLQNNFAITPIQFGWYALLVAIFSMAGSLTTSFIVMKFGNKAIIISTCSLIFGTSLIFVILTHLFPHHLYAILLPITVLFYAEGALYPAIAGKAYDLIKTDVGIGMALFGSILILVASIGMAIAAYLPHHNAQPLAWLLFSVSFVIMRLLGNIRKKL